MLELGQPWRLGPQDSLSGFFKSVLLMNIFALKASNPHVALGKISILSKENLFGIGPAAGKAPGQVMGRARGVREWRDPHRKARKEGSMLGRQDQPLSA